MCIYIARYRPVSRIDGSCVPHTPHRLAISNDALRAFTNHIIHNTLDYNVLHTETYIKYNTSTADSSVPSKW